MFKPIISKPIVRMAAAAGIAGAIAFAITASPGPHDPGPHVKAATGQPHVSEAGRLRVPVKGNVCSVHGWPNFESKCQFDLREPAGEARIVRVIALQ